MCVCYTLQLIVTVLLPLGLGDLLLVWHSRQVVCDQSTHIYIYIHALPGKYGLVERAKSVNMNGTEIECTM